MKTFITFAVLLFLAAKPALATPLENKIATLKTAVKQELSSRGGRGSALILDGLDQLAKKPDDPATAGGAEMQLQMLLTELSTEEVQKAGKEVLEEIRKEREDRAKADEETLTALLKRVPGIIQDAKTAADLDGILGDLQKNEGSHRSPYRTYNQPLAGQLLNTIEFVKLWQNFLSHQASHQIQAAVSDLRRLSEENYGPEIMSRSQILAQQAALTGNQNPRATIDNIKTLDEMEPALHQLDLGRANDRDAEKAYDNLAPYVQLYTTLKAGLPANVNFMLCAPSNGPEISARLKVDLLLLLFQDYFDSYKGAPPGVGEKPQVYIDRVIADAVSREDWPLLKRAVIGQYYYNRSSAIAVFSSENPLTAIDSLLAASHQEAAAQYALAVLSYQDALKSPTLLIPPKIIGDKLAAIQRDHPQDYEQGMALVNAAAISKTPVMRPATNSMSRPSQPGASPLFDIPGTNQQSPAVPTTNAPGLKITSPKDNERVETK